MRLTILGSGTAAPSLRRSCAGYLLEAGKSRFLLDSGAGTMRRLLELKVSLFKIHHIFYTHLHNDHINDLGAIIWSNNYGIARKKPLSLYGPVGFKRYYGILLNKLLKPHKLNFRVHARELGNSAIKVKDIKIRTHEIRHSSTTKSIAYRIMHKGKAFVYTGDTDYCSETIEIAKNADVLLTECSFPGKTEGHLTPALAGRLAAKANAKLLILTHFYPRVLKTDIRKSCGREFKGKIALAEDKAAINI